MSSPTSNNDRSTLAPGGSVKVTILAETQVRIGPLVTLSKAEPIPDIKGTLTSDQLREIAKRNPPPAVWYEGNEEQLF
jgi:hypothetical protein